MKHSIMCLDGSGHGHVTEWDPGDKLSVKTAEEVFDQLRLPVAQGGQGVMLYDISNPDVPGTEMKAFDPAVSEILAVPQLVGG